MDVDSPLLQKFRDYFMKDTLRLVNTFPSNIKPHFFANSKEKKVYSFINDNLVATQMDYYLDYNEDTFNILVIGPTGAGKSHLINTLFNNQICDSEASVTKEVYFIRGRGQVYDQNKKKIITKNILVADTIGLCDSHSHNEMIELIKERVSTNFKFIDAVYVVFAANRLLDVYVENIKKILNLLSYKQDSSVNSDLRFMFVATQAEFLSNEDRERLKNEFKEKFSIHTDRYNVLTGEHYENIIFTGFMPEKYLNKEGKERVKSDWTSLTRIFKLTGITNRISLQSKGRYFKVL
jgi:GTPase SAR1 family protein